MKTITLLLMVGTPLLGLGAKYVPELSSAHHSAACAQHVQQTAAQKVLHGQAGQLARQARRCR